MHFNFHDMATAATKDASLLAAKTSVLITATFVFVSNLISGAEAEKTVILTMLSTTVGFTVSLLLKVIWDKCLPKLIKKLTKKP